LKTKDFNSETIRISSEYQLEAEPLKTVELVVISMQKNYVNGVTISELILNCSTLIRGNFGNISIFLKALRQLGLTPESSVDYDNLKFQILQMNTYSCTEESFPKLTSVSIPFGLSNVKYSLNTKTIEAFLIEEKKY